MCESRIQKEQGFFLSIEKSATSLHCELIKLPEEKKRLYQDSLKRNIIRDCLLRNKKNHLLSEARSELDIQELRVVTADGAPQFHSQRMDLYQTDQLIWVIPREKNWLSTEMDRRERVLQQDRMRNFQEIEEWKKLCCTDAERAETTED